MSLSWYCCCCCWCKRAQMRPFFSSPSLSSYFTLCMFFLLVFSCPYVILPADNSVGSYIYLRSSHFSLIFFLSPNDLSVIFFAASAAAAQHTGWMCWQYLHRLIPSSTSLYPIQCFTSSISFFFSFIFTVTISNANTNTQTFFFLLSFKLAHHMEVSFKRYFL